MGDTVLPFVSALDKVSLSCFWHFLLHFSSAVCRLCCMLLQPCPLLKGMWAHWRWRAKQCNLPVASCILLLVYQLLCSLLNFHSLYKSNFPLTYIGVCLSEKGVQMPDSAHLWLRWQIEWECCYIWGYHVGKGESGFAYMFNLYTLIKVLEKWIYVNHKENEKWHLFFSQGMHRTVKIILLQWIFCCIHRSG